MTSIIMHQYLVTLAIKIIGLILPVLITANQTIVENHHGFIFIQCCKIFDIKNLFKIISFKKISFVSYKHIYFIIRASFSITESRVELVSISLESLPSRIFFLVL